MENDNKVQKNNWQYRIENEDSIHDVNLMIKELNKKSHYWAGVDGIF